MSGLRERVAPIVAWWEAIENNRKREDAAKGIEHAPIDPDTPMMRWVGGAEVVTAGQLAALVAEYRSTET